MDDTVVEIETEVKRVVAAQTAPIHIAMQQICAALLCLDRVELRSISRRPAFSLAIDGVVANAIACSD
ncbi:hypothetical protein [Bradyrhizobium nitroreducens]|uniref:hypothetical protein n=1 Tax=Bradyrhizobium nitroreducens TaxID=709803 RepID=UPI000C1DF852|nr:hypothetical protein [Bradyrhizobium nitroreducens]